MNLIKFLRDTAFRKQYFVPESFAHPAKMDAQLLIWIVEQYTKVGGNLTITPELLYAMDKDIGWCDCDKSDMQGVRE